MEINSELLKWSLFCEGFLVLFLFVHIARFFWKHKNLEVTVGFLILLSALTALRFYDWGDSLEITKIKSWTLLTLFFLIALSPYEGFFLKKFFLPKHIRKFIARGGPLDEVAITCEVLSQEKVGALIAVERRNSLKTYINRGVL